MKIQQLILFIGIILNNQVFSNVSHHEPVPSDLIYPYINVFILFSILGYYLIPSFKSMFAERAKKASADFELFENRKKQLESEILQLEAELKKLPDYRKSIEADTDLFIQNRKRYYKEENEKESKQLEWSYQSQLSNLEKDLLKKLMKQFLSNQEALLNEEFDKKLNAVEQQRMVMQKLSEVKNV